MKAENLQHFKDKLLYEKRQVQKLLCKMKKNETIDSNEEMMNELSNYDNHPADAAGNLYDKEIGISFKKHENTILNEIDEALDDIEKGTYGICKLCGKKILDERLQVLPYARYCTACKNELNSKIPQNNKNRCVEEKVLGNPFGYGYNDFTGQVEFDAEDSYQCVEKYNYLKNITEYENYEEENEGFVEEIEKISNQEYKNQLPD